MTEERNRENGLEGRNGPMERASEACDSPQDWGRPIHPAKAYLRQVGQLRREIAETK